MDEQINNKIIMLCLIAIYLIIIIITALANNRFLMQTASVVGGVYAFVFLIHWILSDTNRKWNTLLTWYEWTFIATSISFLIYVVWGELIKEHPIRQYTKMSLIASGFISAILVYNLIIIKIYTNQDSDS